MHWLDVHLSRWTALQEVIWYANLICYAMLQSRQIQKIPQPASEAWNFLFPWKDYFSTRITCIFLCSHESCCCLSPAEYTLDRLPVQRHTGQTTRHTQTHAHICKENLETPISIIVMFLDCGRKLERMNALGKHANSMQKDWESNAGASCCKATVLLCSPGYPLVRVYS